MSAKSEVEKYIEELKSERDIARTQGNHKKVEVISIKINTANKIKSIYEQNMTMEDCMSLERGIK